MFPVLEHQIVREIDGWSASSALEEETVSKNTFLQVIRKVAGRPRADSVPSWWRSECINESVVEVPVPHFCDGTEEVMNGDRFLDVPVPHRNEQSEEVLVSASRSALDVPASRVKKRLVEVPIFLCQDRIKQRTFKLRVVR